jgi:hypothetical protein
MGRLSKPRHATEAGQRSLNRCHGVFMSVGRGLSCRLDFLMPVAGVVMSQHPRVSPEHAITIHKNTIKVRCLALGRPSEHSQTRLEDGS